MSAPIEASLDLACGCGAAIGVAERMGIMDEIRRRRTDMLGASLINGAGKNLTDMDGDSYGFHSDGDVEIMRGDLAQILYEATRRDTEYIFEDSITGISQDEHGVKVTFERSEPRAFDLVVGADGLHSNVRSLTFGDESEYVHHLGYHVSVFTAPNHLGLDHWGLRLDQPD